MNSLIKALKSKILRLSYLMLKLDFFILRYILFFLASHTLLSQEYFTKNIVLDIQTRKPLSNVHIYNEFDNTITNNEGMFSFSSKNNNIIISHLGYEINETKFEDLILNDSIFLKPKDFNLEEVILTNSNSSIRKAYENVSLNYPFYSFNNEFFIRCVLRKNNTIIKLQDMVVNIERNTLFTNQTIKEVKYKSEVLNIRKAGITPKSKKEEEFKLLSIEELFGWYSAIFTVPNLYKYQEIERIEKDYAKISFEKNTLTDLQKSLQGYYVINLNDYAFNEVFYNTVFEDSSKITFNHEKDIKWRTVQNELRVDFKLGLGSNKHYFLNNGILKTVVEVINNDVKSIYEATYEVINVKNNMTSKIKSNFSPKKDLFKADFTYDKVFWEKQNLLLLNKELQDFIKNIKNLEKEYYIYTNFKDF